MLGADLFDGLDAGFGVHVENGDARALFLHHVTGSGQTEARGATSDDDDFLFDTHDVVSFMCPSAVQFRRPTHRSRRGQ
jgi:hypothetical protein